MAPKKKKEDRSDEPRNKREAELAYAELMTPPGKKRPKKPKGEILPGLDDHYKNGSKDRGGTMKDVEKYYKEKWKTKDLQEQIKKKKKLAEIARLKAKGRELRKK